jgi:hypothetical protein
MPFVIFIYIINDILIVFIKQHTFTHISLMGGDEFMDVNALINLIVNNGFAIAVAAYLLIRLEKQIDNLSGSINKLNTIISTKLGVVIDNDNSDKVA